jgi:hypothetical protein
MTRSMVVMKMCSPMITVLKGRRRPNLLTTGSPCPAMTGGSGGEGYDLDDFAARAPTLRDHVDRADRLRLRRSTERLVATDIADQLDAAGYIVGDLAETVERLSIDQAPSRNMCGSDAPSRIRTGRSFCPIAIGMPCVATWRARTASTRRWRCTWLSISSFSHVVISRR